MSLNTEAQVSPQNGNEHVVNAPRAAGAATPEAEVHPAVAEFRQRFLTESRLGFLMALGEEPSQNLAALMAPQDHQSAHLQRLEDSCLRRMWRLINAFGKVRQGILENKNIKIARSKPECV